MLLALRDYLNERKSATLQEIAWHFQQSPDQVRIWLQHWMRKGRVSCVENKGNCNSPCHSCQTTEVYHWRPPL